MHKILFGLLVLLLVSLVGCSDDATTPPPVTHHDGTIRGHISDADFEYEIPGDPGDPFGGPFLLRGSNLHYDDNAQQLVVDLAVKNLGSYSHHEPVVLTFVRLDPDEVTVANPDNDVHGDGAAIVFPFANDDGVWTPDEESLPRTVNFSVSKGVSIAFVARLDAGNPVGGGTIDGVVWNDANQDGVRDDNEPGVPGIDVYWGDFATGGDSTETHSFGRVTTDIDGHYAIGPLAAGGWVVTIAPSTIWFFPTTPTEIHVLLVEVDGEVSDYHNANFGGIPDVTPPPPTLGEHLHATGTFLPPDHFGAGLVEHFVCPDDTVPGPLAGGGTEPGDYDCYGGLLRGPVTEIAPMRNALRVMATWMMMMDTPLPADLKVGDRVEVRVHQGPGPAGWVADYIAPWNDLQDHIEGRIDAFEIGPDGQVQWWVLDTLVVPANITVGKQ